jgi:hypothetical protein
MSALPGNGTAYDYGCWESREAGYFLGFFIHMTVILALILIFFSSFDHSVQAPGILSFSRSLMVLNLPCPVHG